VNLDSIDKKLANLVQKEFPLQSSPYRGLSLKLGITEGDVLHRIKQLKTSGIIRRIGPLFDARSLGYKTTLVATRVTETEIDKAARFITEHPGVSHAYERDHHFNLWFTLAIPSTVKIDTEMKRLSDLIQADALFALPALKLFKLQVYFDLAGDGQTGAPNDNGGGSPQETALSSEDKRVINEIQGGLPLVLHPYTDMAIRLRMNEDIFLARCRHLLSLGIIRRFSASVNHRKAGFAANAMTCWAVPKGKVDTAGRRLASLREVSHCYERKTNPLWRYNLFAMIHGQSREECQQIADKVSAETGLVDCELLFSTREFKKTRIKYLV
jgi:DNA-binding Lrp family transcriptional regulator